MRSPTTWKRKCPDSITPGVDRPDRDLVGVVAGDRAPSSARASRVVVDERPQRLVAVEADAVEVVRLALVPAGRRSEVDDASARARRAAATRLEREVAVRPRGSGAHDRRRRSVA